MHHAAMNERSLNSGGDFRSRSRSPVSYRSRFVAGHVRIVPAALTLRNRRISTSQ